MDEAAGLDARPPGQGDGEQPLAYRAVRGGVWVALSSYWQLGFGFAVNLFLTRILGPEAFGIFALAQFFAGLFELRSKSGVGNAFAQRKETTSELAGTHLVLDVAGGIATALVTLIAVPILRALHYEQGVILVAVALAGVNIVSSFMGTAWVLLDKHLRFGSVSIVTSVAFPLSYVPAIWLALHGGGYWSLVAQNATYAVLLLAGMWWAARRELTTIWQERWSYKPLVAKQFLRFGVMIGLTMTAGLLLTTLDNFLVGTFVGAATLGFYTRAYQIAQWPSTLVSALLSRTAFYTFTRLQDDPTRLSKTVTMTLWIVTLFALPIALAIFVSAPDLVRLLYGDKWLPSAVFVRFLVVYSLFRPILDMSGALFVAVGKPNRATAVNALQLAALVVAATPLTFASGAVGTSVGVGIAFAVGLSAAFHFTRRTVSLSMRTTFAPALGSALVSLVISLGLSRVVDLNGLALWVRVVIKCGLPACVFGVAMWACDRATLVGRVRYVLSLIRGRA